MINIDYLYNQDVAKKLFHKKYFVDRKLHFKIIERGTILPHKHMYINGQWTWGFGGIVDSKNEFVKSSFVRYGAGAAYTPTNEVKYIPTSVVYLELFIPNWGHNITDNFRRLWFLKSEVFREYFKNCPIVYVPWGGTISIVYQKNFRRLLEILEIDVNKLLPITRPIKFENIILPDESYFFEPTIINTFFTNEYRETIDRIRDFAQKNQTPTSSKKIYYFYGSKQVGEERLAEYFRSKGYEIISPEKLTLDEQLNLLINAESFASTLGSCAHNSVFLRDGTETIFIPRAANRFTVGRQDLIDQLRNLNANYIDSSLSIFETINGPYCYIISEQLKKFFGDEFKGYSEDDFKVFITYMKSCMSRGFKQNEGALKYYGEVFQNFLGQLRQREDLLKAYGINLG